MKKVVNVAELEFGVYIDSLDRPWLETPFLFQGFILSTPEELEQLRELCEYVYIDTALGKDIAASTSADEQRQAQQVEMIKKVYLDPLPKRQRGVPASARVPVRTWLQELSQQRPRPPKSRVTIEEEYATAAKVHHEVERLFSGVLADIEQGRSIDSHTCIETVNEIIDSLIRNRNALMCLTQLRNKDDYTSTHSIDVCVLSLTFGRFLGMERDELELLGLGTLLHDVGKVKVPDTILNKCDRLSNGELATMKRHVEYGIEILEQSQIPAEAIQVARTHHERWDGSGYPFGLSGDQIGKFGLIVSIIDVFSALTGNRPYRRAMQPFEVLSKLYEWRNKEFNDTLVEEFIRCIGIYPVGSIVKLTNGELGVVVSVNHRLHLRPKVALLRDADGNPYPHHRIIDLTQVSDPATGKLLEIASVIAPDEYDIYYGDFEELVARLNPVYRAESELQPRPKL